ncbi:hypothetical protein K3172_12980 [Qipengyuania sp. 6B39]|uniref:hypothetical protein n=1 Tax=Qipengyuania proteolytica TaxID=2867239 RepID=UPI001C89A109|nr:hypothetical protein [Qipengyuania proteolytica]MBX7496773.1 hypothetical protein [Qipengyuania proteolytica]
MAEAGNSGEVDLFGDPVIYRDAKKGRPAHERTARNANKVSLLFALGHEVKDVAAALGITQPTLRKHYFSEVQQRDAMRLKLKAEVLSSLFDQAQQGNVGAMKKLLDQVEKGELVAINSSVKARRSSEAPKPKALPIGKKQERQMAAEGVTGIFEPRPAPSNIH